MKVKEQLNFKELRMHRMLRNAAYIFALLFYLISLMMPVFANKKDSYGFLALILGWAEALDQREPAQVVYMMLAWFSNLTFISCLLFNVFTSHAASKKFRWLWMVKRFFLGWVVTSPLILGPVSFLIYLTSSNRTMGEAFYLWSLSYLLILVASRWTLYINHRQADTQIRSDTGANKSTVLSKETRPEVTSNQNNEDGFEWFDQSSKPVVKKSVKKRRSQSGTPGI